MKEQLKKRVYEILLILYVLFILWFCVLSRTAIVYEVRPLGWSFQYMWNCWWMTYLFLQTVGNVLLYVPLGFLATCKFGINKYKQVALTSILVCISIETIQFVCSCGTLDFDDIVNILIGAGLGYLSCKMFKTRKVCVVAIGIVAAYMILGFQVAWVSRFR